MDELAEKDLDRISGGDGGAELNMIQLQSSISQRQTALQMTTSILQHMHDTTKGIINNIR